MIALLAFVLAATQPFISGEEAVKALPQTSATRRIIHGSVERSNGRDAAKSAPFAFTIDRATDYRTELSHPSEASRALAIYALPRPSAEEVRDERWLVTPNAIRRMRELEQIDYEDFRDTDSGRLPFRAQWSRAGERVTFTIERIESRTLQVLHDIPESQLFLAMNMVAQSLGVRCEYCHVKSGETWLWSSEEKPMKRIAREEMRTLRAGTTCYTCHRGSTSVARDIPLPPREVSAVAAAPLPSAEEVLRRYRAAIGDVAPKAVILRGTIDSKARRGPMQIAVTPPNTYAITFDGVTRTTSDDRTAAMYAADKVRIDAAKLMITGSERIGARETWVGESGNVRFYFDKESGLLVRRLTTTETSIGPLPEQVDYEDYREVRGTKLPFVIRTSNAAPFDTATRTFTSVVAPEEG